MRLLTLFLVLASVPLFGQDTSQLPDAPLGYQLQVSRNGTLYAVQGLMTGSSIVIYKFESKTNVWQECLRLDGFLTRLHTAYDDLFVGATLMLSDKSYVTKIQGPQLDSIKSGSIQSEVSCIGFGYDSTFYVGTPYYGVFATSGMEYWDTVQYPSIFSWDRIDDLFVTPNALYVSNNNAVISTTDKGKTWKQYYFGLPVTKIVVFRDTIYGVTSGGQFLRGVDTLSIVGPILEEPTTRSTLFIDRNGTLFYHNGYTSSPSTLMYSRDRGDTWNEHPLKVTSIACDSSGIMYFAVGNKIYESSDQGASWNLLDIADEAKPERVMSYPNPVIDDCVLAGVANGEVVEIYNMLGVKVTTAYYHHGLDLRGLVSGVYQLVVADDQVRQVQIVKH